MKLVTIIPITTKIDFGHTSSIFTTPYGVLTEINSEKKHLLQLIML